METNSQDKYLFKRGRNKRGTDGVGFALLLILFGGAFLLLNLGIIPAIYKPLLISWQMLLVLIGVWSIFVRRKYGLGILLIGFGIFFIYPTLSAIFPEYFINLSIDFKTYWPLILIGFGILLVLSKIFPLRKKEYKEWNKIYDIETNTWENSETADNNSSDFFEKNMIFGGSEQIVLSQNFKGGEVNVIFGELILDLRKAKLAEGIAHLELNTIFGNLIVYVPSDWDIDIDSTTILGALQDKRFHKEKGDSSQSSEAPKFLIEANAVFGNIELRN